MCLLQASEMVDGVGGGTLWGRAALEHGPRASMAST